MRQLNASTMRPSSWVSPTEHPLLIQSGEEAHFRAMSVRTSRKWNVQDPKVSSSRSAIRARR